MTPREFFDRTIKEDSRYNLARLVKSVIAENEGELLQFFIEEIEQLGEQWRLDEQGRMYEIQDRDYYNEIAFINSMWREYGLSDEDYEERIKALGEPPTPFDIPIPSLPDNFKWAMDRLKDSLTQPDPPTPVSDPNSEELSLPPELDSPKARKYFKRAMERGYIKTTTTGLEWVAIGGGRGGNAQLGYFLSRIYPQPRPINALERLFDVKKLSSNLTNAEFDYKRANVKRWRAEIDNIFND